MESIVNGYYCRPTGSYHIAMYSLAIPRGRLFFEVCIGDRCRAPGSQYYSVMHSVGCCALLVHGCWSVLALWCLACFYAVQWLCLALSVRRPVPEVIVHIPLSFVDAWFGAPFCPCCPLSCWRLRGCWLLFPLLVLQAVLDAHVGLFYQRWQSPLVAFL